MARGQRWREEQGEGRRKSKKENAEDEDVVRLFLQGGWLRIKWRGARFAR